MGELFFIQPDITSEMRANLYQVLTDEELKDPRDWAKIQAIRHTLGLAALRGEDHDGSL